MYAVAELASVWNCARDGGARFESAGSLKSYLQSKGDRVKQRAVGLRSNCVAAALMSFNPVLERQVVSSVKLFVNLWYVIGTPEGNLGLFGCQHLVPPQLELARSLVGMQIWLCTYCRSFAAFVQTLRLIKCAVGKAGPHFKREIELQAGRVRSLLSYEGQSDDLKGEAVTKSVGDTGREGIEAIDAICVSGETSTSMEEVGECGKPQARSKLEENVDRLEESFGSDVHIGIVGETEGREPAAIPYSFPEVKQPGILEGGEESLGKTKSQNASSQLEENVRKLEQSFPPELRAGIVGKTEGREVVSTPASLDSEALPRVKKNVDNAENQNPPVKLENSVSIAESQNAPGKLDEKVQTGEELPGTDVVKVKSGNAETADLKPAENPGKPESRQSSESEQGKVARRTESSISGKGGSGNSECVIQFASKGAAEAEYVEKLRSEDGLHLPGGVVVTIAAESTDTSGREAFDVNAYLKNLATSQFGRLVLYSSLIPSTHTLLSQNFHSFPAGTICVAGAQLQGRGRGGNVWQSPKGCLMFSYTTQMTNGRMVPFLQYVVSLAVIEGVDEACKASGIPAPDVRIKWPNDLYAKGLKIGGVLCTSSYRDKTFNIVMGVGLNVGNREPTTCLDAVIEELQGGSSAIQQEFLLASIMSRFEILNKIFQEQGFLPLQDAYYRKWLHTGQRVVLEEKEPGSSSISHVAVTIQGLTPMGYLLASDDVGEQYELHPDGNSFDFLKGLVRQKLPV